MLEGDGFRVELLLQGVEAAFWCYAYEQDFVAELCHVAVAFCGCGARLSWGGGGGDDEQSAVVYGLLPCCGQVFIHSSCQDDDDGLFSFQQEVEHVLFQL